MKKLVWAFCALVLLMACNGSKTQVTEEEQIVIQDTVESDTLDLTEAEEALPARADELFDDFIFSYSTDSAVQRVRTFFPLPYTADGEKTTIKKKDWEHDPLFSNRDFYTVIFNSEDELQLEKDTSLIQVRVEFLDLQKKKAKRYQFKRYQGIGVWCLYGIEEDDLNTDLDAYEFLNFYKQFACDSIFQRNHVSDPLTFITTDPDDDFGVIETTLELDQWFAFRPNLPENELTNVNYGQTYPVGSATKTLCIHGCNNGINNILTFTRRDGRWMLVAFEDTSY